MSRTEKSITAWLTTRYKTAILSTVVATALAALPASAATVSLKTSDGTLAIDGELISFDGATYIVRTTIGTLTVDASNVTCTGDGCPEVEEPVPEIAGLQIAAPAELAPALRQLLLAYATASGAADAAVTELPSGGFAVTAEVEGGAIDISVIPSAPDADIVVAPGLAANDVQHLASDAIAFVAGPDLGIQALNRGDLRNILTGRISNWRAVDCPSKPIEVILPEDPALREGLAAALPGVSESALVRSVAVSGTAAEILADRPGALAVTRLSRIGSARPLPLDGGCGLQVVASADAVRAGIYPFSLPISLDLQVAEDPVAQGFVEFATGPTAAPILEDAGLVSPGIVGRPISAHGAELASALARARGSSDLLALQDIYAGLQNAERLSTVFWFDSSSPRLNSAAEDLAEELAAHLNANATPDTRLVVVGFSDALEGGRGRTAVSRRRAEAVARALSELGRSAPWATTIERQGFNAIAPLGCNNTPDGRALNRRVEVWLRPAG